MEKIDLKVATYRYNGRPVEEITLFGNGSFCVLTAGEKGKVCYLFDERGAAFLPAQRYFECGAVLAKGYCLVKESGADEYVLYNKLLEPVCQGIENIQVFANDWYELQTGAHKRLFNAEHQLMAEGYGCCKVFDVGYCLDKDGDGEVWRLYLPNGRFVGTATGVIRFLGDGNRLQERADGSQFDVVSFDGQTIIGDVALDVRQFSNGRFVVSFKADNSEMMFAPDGQRLGVRVCGELLPDGRSVSFAEPGHRIVGLYDRRGYRVLAWPWRLQTVGDYYLIDAENVAGRLFNDNMEVCGDGYFPVRAAGCFSLFEREGPELVMFNRQGKVFSSDCLKK
ncbi:MAG: hypothetical protein J6C85_04620 [Alphaproteobacteria bacterium]|nr:hypothetical protein [Alphaproteobacteria bacterium]